MANSDKAYKLNVSTQLSGKEVAPVAIMCDAHVGSYAESSIKYVDKKEAGEQGAISVVSDEIFTTMEQQQTAIYNDPENNTAFISVTGTGVRAFAFEGYIASPEYSYSAYDLSQSVRALATYSLMESLDFSIYRPNADAALIEFNWEGVNSISDFIYKYVMKLVTDWTPDKLQNVNEFTKKAASNQHTVNTKYLPLFYELLTNSKDTMGWEEQIQAMKDADPDARQMMSRVSLILSQSTGGFLNTINALAEEFQCVYAPEFLNVGRLVNKKYLLEEAGEDITVDIISMDIYAGNKYGLFPLSYVAVCPPMVNADAALIDSGLNYVTYPEDASGVTKIVSVGPGWFPPTMMTVPVKKNGDSETKPKDGIDASEMESEVNGVKEELNKKEEKKGDILKEWAKNTYLWETLAPSQCVAMCVLDFKEYTLGTRYKVKNKKGTELFSGALVGIHHSLLGGANPQVYTQFTFSHITCRNFKVPGAE